MAQQSVSRSIWSASSQGSNIMSRILRSTNIGSALRSRQRGFLLNPYRFGVAGPTFTTIATSDFAGAVGVPANFTDIDQFAGGVRLDGAGAFHNITGAYSGATRNGSFSTDHFATVTISGMGFGTNGDAIGIIWRANSDLAPAEDFYFAYVSDAAVPTLSWGKVLNGTITYFNQNSTIVPWANGDAIRGYCLGTTQVVQKNGVTVYSTTDASLSTGQPGVIAHVGFNDTMRGDSGIFGDVTP